MGHVDHGKTTLLDYIRHTKVAEGEAGGITQHIGAYQAETKGGIVTFLDTPGHEAFTSIRQRGTNATDIAVIVVAADDSIMPQTREAIAHAKAAKVPIIVAINKCDLPQADPEKVKRDLMQVELVPEDFGGDTIVVEISAKSGEGVDDLLEMISLVAEVEELRAAPDGAARGLVIESVLDKRAGVLATVLVQEGTLRVADYIVSGEAWAKIRRLTDHTGTAVVAAGPSVPVQILGFSEQPNAGDPIEAVADEQTAKQLAEGRREERKDAERESIGRKGLTLADLFGKPTKKIINLIVRADAQGSLEAIKGVLAREAETTEEVDLELMLAEVGAPTESDLLLASTADATVITFGVTAARQREEVGRAAEGIHQELQDHLRADRGRAAHDPRADRARVRGTGHRPRRGSRGHPRAPQRQHRRLLRHRRGDPARLQGAPDTGWQGGLQGLHRSAATLQGRRPRGGLRVRVRRPPTELRQRAGRRHHRGLRDGRGDLDLTGL